MVSLEHMKPTTLCTSSSFVSAAAAAAVPII